jgi:hypothetical protein
MNVHAPLVKETFIALGVATIVILAVATLAVRFVRRKLVD